MVAPIAVEEVEVKRFPPLVEVEGVVGWPQTDPSVLDYIHPLALEAHRGHLLNQTTVQVAHRLPAMGDAVPLGH